MAKEEIYGKDVNDGAEAIADAGLANKVVLDVHDGTSDSRVKVHIEESLRHDDSEHETHQDGEEVELDRDGGT